MMRSGIGYDVHRLEHGRPMRLGGVDIVEAEFGQVAHSDGDVVIHALCDALLGAAALDDIGIHFPDTDPAYADIQSVQLLRRVVELLADNGYRPYNVDCMLILERPKVMHYRSAMRGALAEALGIAADYVSLKATTHEGLGPIGASQGVAAYAVATILELERHGG